MTPVYAFKNAARSIELSAGIAKETDRAIAEFTGGKFCHVELWIDGPQNAAVCYSARQPHGVAKAIIDLSDAALWTIVGIGPTGDHWYEDQDWLLGFCEASVGKPYDFLGILGIAMHQPLAVPWDRFCSEFCFEALQLRYGKFSDITDIARYQVAPSGRPPGGYGLYELLTGSQGAATPGQRETETLGVKA